MNEPFERIKVTPWKSPTDCGLSIELTSDNDHYGSWRVQRVSLKDATELRDKLTLALEWLTQA